MEPKILGANIRKYRKQIGITQEQLAEKIGKSVTTFVLIANAIGISTDILLVGITENSYAVQNSLYNERIGKLDNAKRNMLYSVIDAILNSVG